MHRADARHELTEAEGLHDVVVGGHLEQEDAVDLVLACSHHDDRDPRSLPQTTAHLSPVEVGQSEVEQHDVAGVRRECLGASAHPTHGEPLVLQALGQGLGDCGVVLHDQHPQGGVPAG